jgi:hypothetical protein
MKTIFRVEITVKFNVAATVYALAAASFVRTGGGSPRRAPASFASSVYAGASPAGTPAA